MNKYQCGRCSVVWNSSFIVGEGRVGRSGEADVCPCCGELNDLKEAKKRAEHE